MRRRAERLLADIRSLEIHRHTFSDVQNLKRKWKSRAHFEGNCTEDSCRVEISWDDFYFRHIEFLSRHNVSHLFMLAGGRPQQIRAQVRMDKGFVSGKGFHAVVGVPAYRWWPDYALLADAYSVPSFAENYRRPATHPHYAVGRPGGCDGPCRGVHFIFDPSVDSGTINRFMQFDLSCLTRWIHACRTEGDIMPNAWAQAEADYGSVINQ
ncbi:MAG TPA: hypothetical protein VN911_20160 [Candidatus Acidoferrum sp.]|nr:hypothetical protein [Candidatus Acidoferrum sp.]